MNHYSILIPADTDRRKFHDLLINEVGEYFVTTMNFYSTTIPAGDARSMVIDYRVMCSRALMQDIMADALKMFPKGTRIAATLLGVTTFHFGEQNP